MDAARKCIVYVALEKTMTQRAMQIDWETRTQVLPMSAAMSIGAVNAGGSGSGPSRLTAGTP